MTTVDELDASFRAVMLAMRERTNARADRDETAMASTKLVITQRCREYSALLSTADDVTRLKHRDRAPTLEVDRQIA